MNATRIPPRSSVWSEWHAFLTAFQFLTRVPVPGGASTYPDAAGKLLPRSVKYFPLAGLAIGGATAAVAVLCGQRVPVELAVLIALVFEAILTGGFHEDAVADCGDAFGGGYTRDQVMTILKDSRIGSFGALALLLAVATRWQSTVLIPSDDWLIAIPLASQLGRLSIVFFMWIVPPVDGREGLSKDVGKQVGLSSVLIAILISTPMLVVVGRSGLTLMSSVMLLSIIAITVWGAYVVRRLGGVTGDCLGTGCYLVQVAALIGWVASA